jgi:hypothetical protein
MAAVDVTALLVGPRARPTVDAFCELLTELWEEELVTPRAVLSVGKVALDNAVAGADRVGEGRTVRWKGADLAGLIAAVRASYPTDDVAVWFEKVDLDAFEPAEEEEYEDVEDDGDDDGEDDDGPPAARAAPAKDDDMSLGEFELANPSLVLYSVRAPVELAERSDYLKKPGDEKKLKKFGARAVWATLDGEDMGLLVDDLGDSWLLDVFDAALGEAKVGKHLW